MSINEKKTIGCILWNWSYNFLDFIHVVKDLRRKLGLCRMKGTSTKRECFMKSAVAHYISDVVDAVMA